MRHDNRCASDRGDPGMKERERRGSVQKRHQRGKEIEGVYGWEGAERRGRAVRKGFCLEEAAIVLRHRQPRVWRDPCFAVSRPTRMASIFLKKKGKGRDNLIESEHAGC